MLIMHQDTNKNLIGEEYNGTGLAAQYDYKAKGLKSGEMR